MFIISPRGNPPPHTGVGYYTTTMARTCINLVSLVLFSLVVKILVIRRGASRQRVESPRAPQCSNLKGLPEPEIRHLARQVGVRRNPSSAASRSLFIASMADACRARTERRAALATRVAQTAPVGGRPRCSPSPAANAATGPAGNEQQASSQHPSVRQDGRTAPRR